MHCPLCGASAAAPAFIKDGYPIARCACGMVFVSRAVDPAVLERLYSETYFAGGADEAIPGYQGYDREERVMRRNFVHRLAFIERTTGRGPLLDVGCALGFFVRTARDQGWDARGVELSAWAAQQAVTQGLPVTHGDFLAVDLPAASFTAVTMFDVLEHMADPRAYVRRARRLLRTGGAVVVETADLSSPFPRLLGRRYHFFSPPNHLTYFTRGTLTRLLREEGFGTVELRRVGKWVSVRRLVHHLHLWLRRPVLGRLLGACERTGLADVALPISLGDDMLAIGRLA